jgi:hypothetical protein
LSGVTPAQLLGNSELLLEVRDVVDLSQLDRKSIVL